MIDTLIIGAGPSGLCAAKTFLQHDPEADIVIIDAGKTLGGVWSKERLYPTLKTNNLFSTIDFSDFPMDPSRFGINPGEHVTGEAMHAYIQAYADHFNLTHRVRFNKRVKDIRRQEPDDEGDRAWIVEVGDGETFQCRKLVVATGVLTNPHMPKIDGVEDFHVPFVHSADIGGRTEELINNPSIKTIGVIGGSKSAYDAVYLAASTGHNVEWIIRKSGRGPVWVMPPHTMMGPFKALREKLLTRRLVSFMSPWSFPDHSGLGWIRNFLHFSWLGKKITQKFWGKLQAGSLKDGRYRNDKDFAALEPEQNPFWYGTASGILNYGEDILKYVSDGQVKIHRADISHLTDHAIHIHSDGKPRSLPVDALVACTGYSAKPSLTFSPPALQSDLGVPSTSFTKSQSAFWSQLDDRADLIIGNKFPRLLLGPFHSPTSSVPKQFHLGASSDAETPYTPWRLYQGIAPPNLTAAGDHSLVFISMFSNVAATIRLEIQCLWALAYFNHGLPSVRRNREEGKVFLETALFQRYSQRRAPYGHGRSYPDLVVDQLPYWDLLLHDLGLETRRKGGWRELLEPYTQQDYAGLVDEWLAKKRLAQS
ncbi:cofactor FMO1 FAD enzyme [Cercophora newfieldiana]|uniref:Cofactor FMO1 FAD enzyme n=1 Tax=Cercophora newfieldiana TaxID=92897 RepID=A0AA40CHY2_9PEZI|nr:cofactor FMO1 FAD enzyme [Cercophora newfieldiana]